MVQEMAKGYKLHDRLVRPAAVVVSRPRPAKVEPAAAAPTEGQTTQSAAEQGAGGGTGGTGGSSQG